MKQIDLFPFGQPVRKVEQIDRTPKRIFVLGVYASAVHARWSGPDGKPRVRALAVASEPYIFWQGDGAKEIIQELEVPSEVGRLMPAAARFNGPSGLALDALFLHPLGLRRADAWLCDLLPYSRMNPSQKKAIERAYLPLVDQYQLPSPTIRPVPRILADDQRREEILNELENSQANTLILLGDEPIRWFLKHFDSKWKRLSDFGDTTDTYGQLHPCEIGSRTINVLPLVHPRQAAQLGRSTEKWFILHNYWKTQVAEGLLHT